MKSVKLWMLVAIILAGSISVLGQTQPPASAQKLRVDADGPPVRDSQALGFVEQALAALGGKMPSCRCERRCSMGLCS